METQTFADIPVFDKQETKEKTVYTKIVPGIPLRIRILDKKAYAVLKHYLPKQRISVVCLEDECPICINNRKLVEANPDTQYNEIPGILPRQRRFLVNVLNRTKVKKTTNGTYFAGVDGKFPPVSSMGEDLSTVEAVPLNTVEVLDRGVSLFRQFNAISESYRDEDGEPIGLTNFDIILTASGKGKSMTVTALPALQYSDAVSVDRELYDLSKVPMTFDKESLWKLLEGASVQDVYEAKRAKSVIETDAPLQELQDGIEDALNSIFED